MMAGCFMKWVKHDTDANQDDKLQNVLLDYGLEGYGLYWYCIELIAGKVDKDNVTFELKHDARIIAKNTGSTPQKTEEMMRYFVKIGLFENAAGIITCMKLAKRLDKSMTSNPEMRVIISNLKGDNHDRVMTVSAKPMQDKIRLDQIREEKEDNASLVLQGFNNFWLTWSNCKKEMDVKNTSSKSVTLEKFKKIFNKAYFENNPEQGFKGEIESMCKFAEHCHSDKDNFNPYKNMQTGKFLTSKGWRD